MITFLLLCSIVVATILAWLNRSQLTRYIPRKETLSIVLLIASIVVLTLIALLPDILIVLSTINLLPPFFKTALVLSATASLVFFGCSKHIEAVKPRQVHWRGTETDFSAETTPPPDNGAKSKEDH